MSLKEERKRSKPDMRLSIVMPVYNEIDTIEEIVEQIVRVELPVRKELIIVDDGSTDGTHSFLENLKQRTENSKEKNRSSLLNYPLVKVLFHSKNQGKGAALKTGFQHATGDILVIQDADLEYDPVDWKEMLRLFLDDRADVVFGSRFYGKSHRVLYYHHFLVNKIISALVNLLCDINLSDVTACYKMFRREILDSLSLARNDFAFDVEFTVKVARSRKWRLYETAVSYYGRTYAEGKKINWRDAFKIIWCIFKFKFS